MKCSMLLNYYCSTPYFAPTAQCTACTKCNKMFERITNSESADDAISCRYVYQCSSASRSIFYIFNVNSVPLLAYHKRGARTFKQRISENTNMHAAYRAANKQSPYKTKVAFANFRKRKGMFNFLPFTKSRFSLAINSST